MNATSAVVVASLAALLAVLAAQRNRGPLAHTGARWGIPQGTSVEWLLASLATLGACIPILRGLPILLAPEPLLIGDAATHAAVAQQIAREGLPHGWIDRYSGGFPFGVHYQSVGYLLVAALVRAGLSTARAMQAAGVGATLALSFVVLAAARRAGAHPAVAVVGAWLATWVSPANTFIGGWETYLTEGLLAQSLALPLAVIAGASIALDRESAWRTPVFAALLMATHPQIATGLLAVMFPAFFFAATAGYRARYLRAGLAQGAVGIAIYGRGVLSLQVPFGFSGRLPAWKQIGYPIDRLPDWLLEGELFDAHRGPAFTIPWLVSAIFLTVLARRAVPRAVLVTMLTALGLSVCGHTLQHLGGLGRVLLSFIMPLRITALLMLMATASVVVALEELRARIAAKRALAIALLASVLAFVAAFAAPSRFEWAARQLDERQRARVGSELECLHYTPRGYATRDVISWLRELDHGRFTFDVMKGHMGFCPGTHGVELAVTVPMGLSGGAATHMATNVAAFESLRPTAKGAWMRAETLGVRSLLHTVTESPPANEAWRVVHSQGDMRLSERVGGTDLVGVGCVTETWRGDDASVRRAMNEDLYGAGTLLEHPRELTVIESSGGAFRREPAAKGACDANLARVEEKRREAGALEATIDSPSEVDVVFRATAFSTWIVTVDGSVTPWKMVAPGFFSVRVPAGAHRVEAVAHWPTAFRTMIAFAFLLVAWLAYTKWPMAWVIAVSDRMKRRFKRASNPDAPRDS